MMDINEAIQTEVEARVKEAMASLILPAVREQTTAALRAAFGKISNGVDDELALAGQVQPLPDPNASVTDVDARYRSPKAAAAKRRRRARKAKVAASTPLADAKALAQANLVGKGLTVAKAAELAGVSVRTVYNLVRDGKVQARRVPVPPNMKRGPRDGKITVISVASFKAWRKSQN